MPSSRTAALPEPELAQIPVALLDHYWPGAEPYLAAAHARMGSDPPAVMFDRLVKRKADLWCVFAGGEMLGAGVASITGKTVKVEALGGRELHRWLHLFAEYEALARAHGMTEVEIEGRPGWARRLAGYRVKRIVLGKTL